VEAQRQRTGSYWPGSIMLLPLKHSRSPGFSLAASARVTARHVGYHKPSTPYRTSVLDTDCPPSCPPSGPPSERSFSSIRLTHRAWHACCVARTIVPLIYRVNTEGVLFIGERTFSIPACPSVPRAWLISHWLSEDAQIPWHAPPKQPDSGITLFITLHHTRSTTFPTETTHSY
jgi:hypothetical protein